MNDFDDLLTGALDARGASAGHGTADPGDAVRRAKHHRAVRRSVAGSCVGVLAIAGVVGLALRAPSGDSPSVADGPGVQEPATSCPEGQILSSEGDIVLHEGQPYAVSAGQCITATKQEPTITSCEVSVGGGTAEAGIVSSTDGAGAGVDSKGCVVFSGEPCPAPAVLPDPETATTVIIKTGDAPADVPWVCTTSCGVVITSANGASGGTPPDVVTGSATIVTAFVDESSDSEGSTESDQGPGGPPNMIAEACAAASGTVTPPSLDTVPTSTVEVQG